MYTKGETFSFYFQCVPHITNNTEPLTVIEHHYAGATSHHDVHIALIVSGAAIVIAVLGTVALCIICLCKKPQAAPTHTAGSMEMNTLTRRPADEQRHRSTPEVCGKRTKRPSRPPPAPPVSEQPAILPCDHDPKPEDSITWDMRESRKVAYHKAKTSTIVDV